MVGNYYRRLVRKPSQASVQGHVTTGNDSPAKKSAADDLPFEDFIYKL